MLRGTTMIRRTQNTACAINLPPRQTVDISKANPQDSFLSFLIQCPLIDCNFALPKCDTLPPFLYTSEAAEDVEFTRGR